MKSKLFHKEKFMITQLKPVLAVARDLFLPSVYDALLVLRPSCNFRDGTVITHWPANLAQYFRELPFNDSYFFGLLHLLPANYKTKLRLLDELRNEVCDMNARDVILGFASVFLLTKAYSNFLAAELSQLCYGGVLRAVALGSTDGLCTWKVGFLMGFQPVIVPVGRITLGRIFNVLGSVIDPYMELPLSSEFTFAGAGDNVVYENCLYENEYASFRLTFDERKLRNRRNGLIVITRTIFFDWIFYIGYFYENSTLAFRNWTPYYTASGPRLILQEISPWIRFYFYLSHKKYSAQYIML
jgi:hypothetical protein